MSRTVLTGFYCVFISGTLLASIQNTLANTQATRFGIPVVQWTQQLGTSGSDFAEGVSIDTNGNSYVTGHTTGAFDGNMSFGGRDMFLTKLDRNGVEQWTRQFGTASNDSSRDLSVDESGNIYVAGRTGSTLDGPQSGSGDDMFLTKYDAAGVNLWTRQIGASGFVVDTYGVSVDGNGNAYVTGQTGPGFDGHSTWGMFLAKYDTAGTKLWTQVMGITTGGYVPGRGVAVDSSGNAYIAGYTNGTLEGKTNAGGDDIVLVKYNTDGVEQWSQQLGTGNRDQGLGVSVDNSGNAYVTGLTEGSLDGTTVAGGTDAFLMKYDTAGNRLWARQMGNGTTWGTSVSVDSHGNAFVSGTTDTTLDGNTSAGREDAFLSKYNTNGIEEWTLQLGTNRTDYGLGVSVDSFGAAYLTGWTEGSFDGNVSAGGQDIFLVKVVPEPSSLLLLVPVLVVATLRYRQKVNACG